MPNAQAPGARTFEAQLKDGSWLHISERRTKDGGYVSVGTDITRIKEHEQKLVDNDLRLRATVADLQRSQSALERQAVELADLAQKYAEEKNRAEDANQAKSKFLANMSHELRTPLNAIIGFSEMMTQQFFGPLGSEKYAEYADDIHKSGRHLLSVINDVLDLSKIEADKFDLSEGEVSLAEAMHDAARYVEQRARSEEVVFEMAPPPDIELFADAKALRQMLLNLLTNAVKFTPPGGKVTLRAAIEPDRRLAIVVTDTGPGMRRADIPKAMEAFGQVAGDKTRYTHEGTGLGLPITAALIRLHGGTLVIDSQIGRGTSATLRFPHERILDAAQVAAA